MVSNARHEEMKDFYQKRYDEMHDRYLKADEKLWDMAGECSNAKRERNKLAGKCELYEKLLNRYMANEKITDDIFVFEGMPFKPINYCLERGPDGEDRLTVDFVICREYL